MLRRNWIESAFVAVAALFWGRPRPAQPAIKEAERGNIKLYRATPGDPLDSADKDGLASPVFERVLWRDVKPGDQVIALAGDSDTISGLEMWTVGPGGYIGKTVRGIPGCEIDPASCVDLLKPAYHRAKEKFHGKKTEARSHAWQEAR